MQIIKGITSNRIKQMCLTIGDFDGVHLGHQQLLAKTVAQARQYSFEAVAMLFSPQPHEFFSKKSSRVNSLRDKIRLLAEYGITTVIIQPFNQHFTKISPVEFIKLLTKHNRLKHLVVGYDFHFGHKRQGDVALLAKYAKVYNFTMEQVPKLCLGMQTVSSTLIRQSLTKGELGLVRDLLGRPYSITLSAMKWYNQGKACFGICKHNLLLCCGRFEVRLHLLGNSYFAVAHVNQAALVIYSPQKLVQAPRKLVMEFLGPAAN